MFTGIIKNIGVVKDINDNSLIIKTDDLHFINIDEFHTSCERLPPI